ncbi:hypothetical protein EYF80_064140 [Liparis tanakae]|uniref:Uncharacterized protein n=1 Tax=Liparis tanakae TaxID=230148 RepID=A0A4Z2EA85_9TELE|nr:hypothetical protein EYF80_064140 [Liparis tanakae]
MEDEGSVTGRCEDQPDHREPGLPPPGSPAPGGSFHQTITSSISPLGLQRFTCHVPSHLDSPDGASGGGGRVPLIGPYINRPTDTTSVTDVNHAASSSSSVNPVRREADGVSVARREGRRDTLLQEENHGKLLWKTQLMFIRPLRLSPNKQTNKQTNKHVRREFCSTGTLASSSEGITAVARQKPVESRRERESKGKESKGNESKGNESIGNESKGNESIGKETKGRRPREGDQGKETKGRSTPRPSGRRKQGG